MQQVLSEVARANILNINGAPGFGKSTLAIHVGYKVFKNGTSVRYINIEDKAYSIVNQWHKSEREAMPESCNKVDKIQRSINSLTKLSRHPLSASKHQIATQKYRI